MNEETIFAAALELDSAERANYLAKACGGDPALRKRLEGLLAASDRAGNFMARPAVESPNGATEIVDGESTPQDVTVTRDGPAPLSDEQAEATSFLSPSSRPDSLGRIGHYEVLQILGKGGFGIVFRAFDDVLQRVVAIKVMAPQLAATSPARKRFLREARTSAQVRHENVVQVYEVVEHPLPYLAMEFIPGETLQQRLDKTGPLDVPEALRIGRQIAEGLAAAHATDLIHRDIKPSNVLIEGGPAQRVKITDFGLARAADDASISQSGIIAGTPMYMAPEQALGHKLDQRADIFSLGSVLYQMVAGRAPFRATGTVAVLKRVAEDTPRDIREIIPETPQWLCDIISKLHAKNPDERFQSAREVGDVLADCEAQLKANAKLKDYSRIPRSKPQCSGRRKWVAAAAVLLLPVIALAVTELAGVTHIFRGQANSDPITPGGDATPPIGVAQTPDPDGFVQLFNGKDLTGWNYHPEMPGSWQVKDGLLTSGGPANYVFSDRGDYANFHLRAVARINQTGNSGIFFGAKQKLLSQPGGSKKVDGKEVQIAGGTRATAAPTGSLLQTIISIDAKEHTPADEWFTIEIFVIGKSITIKVNGKTTVDHVLGANEIYMPGHIALQQHTRDTVVQFKKIEIKELPATSTPPTFTNGIGMEFVIAPKGKSWLGGGKDKLGDKEVDIPADFYLGKYEVTQEEWEKVMGENPSHFSRTGGGKDAVKDISDADLKRFPVENVSWDQCQVFVAKLNQREKETGWVYRLPTEAEWEYACRGGPMSAKADSAFDFYFGNPTNTLLPEQANVKESDKNRTCTVGSYPPNRLGLHDVHGNVWEWCQDEQGVSMRIYVGDGWESDSWNGKAAFRRTPISPSARHNAVGLRLARVPSGAPSPEAKAPQVAANVLKDAVLLMNFEKDTFHEKDGKTYARDLSGNGNDGLCDNVEFSPDGKAGGGLLCKEGDGRLQLAKSLILRQPNYTITAWCRWDTRIGPGTPTPLYRTSRPDRRTQSVFDIGIPFERSVHVNAWNLNLLPEYWKNARTDAGVVPAGWFFVAVSLTDGEIDKGKLRIVIDDKIHSRASQMVATGNPVVDFIGNNMDGAVIDELAVFQRALSDEEIAAVRALGMKGTPLNVGKAPPAVAPFTDADVKRIAALPAAEQVEEVRKELMRRNPGFDGKVEHKIEDGVVTEFRIVTDRVTDIAPIRAFNALRLLDCHGTWSTKSNGLLADLTPLSGMNLAGLTYLGLGNTKVTDAGMVYFKDCKNLTALYLDGTKVTDDGMVYFKDCKDLASLRVDATKVTDRGLVHLQDCRDIAYLNLAYTQVSDGGLACLKDWKNLTELILCNTPVSEKCLVHFKGMPLRKLRIENTGITDLTPLQGMPLEDVRLTPKNITRGLDMFRDMKSLKTIGPDPKQPWPAAEFWERYDKGEFGFAPLADADVMRIAALPAKQQVEEVRKELMRRNSGFDGKMEIKIEDGVVTEFRIVTEKVTDIAPIRVFNALRVLDLSGTVNGQLADLTPLEGMNLAGLKHLDLNRTKVSDTTMVCFKDCKELSHLDLGRTKVSDAALIHFKECKNLKVLFLYWIKVSDSGLANFKDCKDLTRLSLSGTKVSDAGLADFKNCKNLTHLDINETQMGDAGLANFKGMRLVGLGINNSGITDLTLLQGMPLEEIRLTPKNISKSLEILRDMKSLKTIGITFGQSWPAAEFWERYDKGEFGFARFTDLDLKRIAALPAKEQVEQVRKELMRRNPGFDGKVEHQIDGVAVTEFKIVTDKVTDIAPIRVFNALRVLDLSGTEVDGTVNGQLADLTPLKGMNLSNLTRLSLNNAKIDDAGLVHFKDCKNLTHLWLNRSKVSNAGMACFKDCRNITNLGLKFTQVDDDGLVHFKDCRNLNDLDLGELPVTDRGLANFKDCKGLTGLWLSRTQATDAGLAHFKDCKDLAMLHLGGTQTNDAALVHLKGCKKLNTAWLDSTQITDAGLAHLAGLDELTKLILVDTKVTAKAVEDLAKALPKCQIKWDGGVIEAKEVDKK